MSTPSHPPGATRTDSVTIEPLPQLPGRTGNQWVNVLRVGGVDGAVPGQTVQSIKLIDSPRFQFPRSQISYVDEMGNGWFGKVMLDKSTLASVTFSLFDNQAWGGGGGGEVKGWDMFPLFYTNLYV